MRRKSAELCQTGPKVRGPYTPGPVRQRVVARYFSGQSSRKIAIAEGLARETVARIVSQPEVLQLTAQCQSKLLSLVPKALGVYQAALESDDPRIALVAATRIIEHTLPKGGVELSVSRATESPDMDRRVQRLLIFGEFVEMTIAKKLAMNIELDAAEQALVRQTTGEDPRHHP
jgi:hypothetical protein